ncbi:AP-2 complex subunit beta-1 [Wickerhamomyces ciferrii]|uniref:AP complex subunit beta n=1 Tax=Wickerhamomyces ciferrii (strain ATCC 14091 / BCRC 22168 / CBS 111 / JCM 3599 / NBRC 0793 / NRRL Y-1031 F-60-10) TaxID=1206466 RepID=K0KJ57_WICCF|nr:AP-2 complex subunit beta-1 [Wickerhamomyces ciferrii]CCH41143.1 AP-2 complex subunit beta-1 [Wickerhamomyces ciferrii]
MSLEKKIKKIFQAPRKGLVSQYASERKDSIKQVIAAMTVGKDVSALFPDVLKNIATHDLKQKKLVYLYLMNYAKTNPELCILAVNTFVQDTEDPNPLVRALAIRTMGCIRVDKIVDYMEIPLNRTLQDENPYVRKTAAICVAKLFDLNKEICIENGFLDKLKKLVEDSNPMVVANSISALAEIHESEPDLQVLKITKEVLKRFLMALNECTEWGRITILTALSDYETEDGNESSHIIERVIPQLQHSNPSVVLSAVKVIIVNVEKIKSVNLEEYETILKKLSSPLVSLVSTPPEVQFVTLRNIRIIIEKYPNILTNYFKVFFVRYNDPLYLKLEKIEIIVRLANETNGGLILNELKEYGYEFDVEFVKRAVRAIGQIGIKISKFGTKSSEILIGLINERELYDTVTITLRDILRAYPKQQSSIIIPTLVQIQDQLIDSEAIAAYIWILGEFENVLNYEIKLTEYVENFLELDSQIQSSLIYSLVKLNVKTGELKSLLAQIFNKVDLIENIEIRDQIYLYWRILSLNDSQELKKLILLKLDKIDNTIPKFQPELLEFLLKEISSLNSVFFTTGVSKTKKTTQIKKIKDIQLNLQNEENLLNFDDDEGISTPSEDQIDGNGGSINILDELNDLFSSSSIQPQQQQQTQQNNSVSKDLLDLF